MAPSSIGVAVIGAGMAGRAHAAAPDIDVVSVVVANTLHREIVEGPLASGRHVLCEKPLAPSVADAQAMVAAARASPRQTAVGFTFRRSPAIAAIRQQLDRGSIGAPVHVNGHYWCDYGCDPGVTNGYRQVLVGPAHPYIDGGPAMDFPGVNYGQNDLFVWQARAFLEQVAGVDGLPRTSSLEDGLRNLRLLAAVVESAKSGGAEVVIA